LGWDVLNHKDVCKPASFVRGTASREASWEEALIPVSLPKLATSAEYGRTWIGPSSSSSKKPPKRKLPTLIAEASPAVYWHQQRRYGASRYLVNPPATMASFFRTCPAMGGTVPGYQIEDIARSKLFSRYRWAEQYRHRRAILCLRPAGEGARHKLSAPRLLVAYPREH